MRDAVPEDEAGAQKPHLVGKGEDGLEAPRQPISDVACRGGKERHPQRHVRHDLWRIGGGPIDHGDCHLRDEETDVEHGNKDEPRADLFPSHADERYEGCDDKSHDCNRPDKPDEVIAAHHRHDAVEDRDELLDIPVGVDLVHALLRFPPCLIAPLGLENLRFSERTLGM